MAQENKKQTGLEAIAKTMAEFRQGVQMPAGEKDQAVENQLTEMDLIAGICSAALFGSSNRTAKNYQQLIANPSKFAYLGKIYDILKEFKPKEYNALYSTVQGTITKNLVKVSLMDIDQTIIDKLSQLYTPELLSTTTSAESENSVVGRIILNIDKNSNLENLNDQLLKLRDITNDASLLLGVQSLGNVFIKLNLINLDSEKLSTNVQNINQGISVLVTKLPELKTNIDKINTLFGEGGDLFKLQIPELNIDTESLKRLEEFGLYLNNVASTFTGLNQEINTDVINNITESINDLNNKLKLNITIDNLQNLFDQFNNLLQNKSNLKNAEGVGELINSIIELSSFSGEINKKGINELARLVREKGPIAEIINNINNLGLTVVSNESIKTIRFIKDYFDTVTSLTDVGIRDKIRIITNITFFKYYVNNALPGLIKDIENNFKGIRLSDRDGTLNNLQNYFFALKNIASLSLKDQINLITSITTLKTLVVEQLGGLVKEINNNFKNIKIDPNITDIFDLFEQLHNLTIPESLDDQRKALYGLHKFLFGTSPTGSGAGGKIGRGLDFIKGESSVLSIINRLQSEAPNFGNVKDPLDKLETVLDTIDELINDHRLDIKDVLNLSRSISRFEGGIINTIIQIGKDKDKKLKGIYGGLELIKALSDGINSTFENKDINDTLKRIVVSKETYKNFEDTLKFFEKLPRLYKVLEICSKLKLSDQVFKQLEKVADQLATIINKFSKIKTKNLEAAIKILNEITKLLIISSAILFIGVYMMNQFPVEALFKFLAGMYVMVLLFKTLLNTLSEAEFDSKSVNEKIKVMYQLGILMVTLSFTLAICTSMMNNVDWKSLAIFGVGVFGLLGMTLGIIYILDQMGDSINNSLPIAKDLALLIIACGLTVSLAALVGAHVNPINILAFGAAIGLLIASILVPMIFFKGVKTILFNGVGDLGKLVFFCGLTLALAGLVADYITMGALLKFTGALLFLVGGIILALSFVTKSTIEGAKDLGVLVMYSAGALLVGGLLFMLLGEPFKQAVDDFMWTLFKFVGGMLLIVGITSLLAKNGFENMKVLNAIVITAAATLLIGGLLFLIGGNQFKKAVNDFALTLFLFVAGIALTTILVGLFITPETLGKMWQLALLIAVSSLCITLGPILLQEFAIPYDDVLAYVGLSILFIAAMGTVIFLLGKIPQEELIKGGLALAGIELLIYGLSLVISEFVKTVDQLNKTNNLWEGIGHIGLIILAVTGVIAALGGIMYSGAGAAVLAMGAAALAIIEGVIWGLGSCILSIVTAVKALNSIKNYDMEKLMKPFFGFLNQAKEVMTVFSITDMVKIKGVMIAFSGIGELISRIANGIAEYAQLSIPEGWDPTTGKPTGFRHLTETDFKEAGKNIGLIISTLGQSILSIYQGKIYDPITGQTTEIMSATDAKEMFSPNIFTGSKFSNVVSSVTKMGDMIANISRGIQEYAMLRIPTKWSAKDGKPIEFKKMTNDDFINASKAIGQVISTLGMSIIAIYNGKIWDPITKKMYSYPGITEDMAKQMFSGDTWFSDSPFTKVVNATSKLGSLISGIAKGIQEYAAGKYPDDWDKDGNPTHWTSLSDMYVPASEHIGKIITTLGESIINVSKTDEFKEYYDPKKMGSLIEQIGTVSNFIGPLADVIMRYYKGEFSILEYHDGQLHTKSSWTVKNWEKFQDTVSSNIKHVILSLGYALEAVLNPINPKDKEVAELLTNHYKINNFTQAINLFAERLKEIFNNLQLIIDKKIWASQIINHVKNPFIYLCNSLALKEGDVKLWIADNNDVIEDLCNGCTTFTNTLVTVYDDLKKIIDHKITTENVNDIADSIDKLLTINFNDNGFSNHAETLEKYVQAINSVDVSKIESMTTLAYAVTDLGNQIGNIDKFTNTLANNVSKTLTKLATEINDAKKVINKADQLHEKRQTHIKNSIIEINKLMEKSMVVEIKNDSILEGGLGGVPDLGDTEQEGGTTTPTATVGNSTGDNTVVNTPTRNMNYGGHQNIKVEIDYNRLAEAIAQAFKKIT